MDKREVVTLARELFKIRMASAKEGDAQDDGRYKSKVEARAFYSNAIIETWHKEAIRTAEIIITLEEQYLSGSILE